MTHIVASSAGSSGQVTVTLQVGGQNDPPPTVVTAAPPPRGPLPYTGAAVAQEVDAAAVLVLLGLVMLTTVRHRVGRRGRA